MQFEFGEMVGIFQTHQSFGFKMSIQKIKLTCQQIKLVAELCVQLSF